MLALHNTSAQPRGLVFRSHLVLTLGAQNDQTTLATSIICTHMTSYVGISWLFWNMLDDLGKQIKLLQTLILHDLASHDRGAGRPNNSRRSEIFQRHAATAWPWSVVPSWPWMPVPSWGALLGWFPSHMGLLGTAQIWDCYGILWNNHE